MKHKGIDMKIPDSLEENNLLIIYKGRKKKGTNNEEEIVELKTSKDEFLRKFRYFKNKINEIEHMSEIFIHDIFYTEDFQNVVESLNTKMIEVREDNYIDLLSLSSKYEYHEFTGTIERFEEERPDLERVITSIINKTNKTNKTKNTEDNEEEDKCENEKEYEYEESDMKKEELIASHLDFFLERGLLNKLSTICLYRIMNSPHRVVNNHHKLFEFIKGTLKERRNTKSESESEYLSMLIGTLDYKEMSIEDIEYIIDNEYFSNQFQPKHSEYAMKNIIEHMKNYETKISELESKLDFHDKMIENFIKTINKLETNYTNHQQEHIQQILTLENKYNQYNKSIQQNIDNLTKKLESNELKNDKYHIEQEYKMTTFIENQIQDITNMKREIKEITQKVESNEQNNIKYHSEQEQKTRNQEENSSKENNSMKSTIEGLTRKVKEIENDNKKEHDEIQRKREDENISHQNNINELNKKIENIEKSIQHNIDNMNQTQSATMKLKPFNTEIHKKTEGILCRLKRNETTPFDHLFIASQSSGDIYNVIDPNTNDNFSINGIGSFLNIELQEPVNITGIKIVSSSSWFPKTLNIEINEKLIKSIEDAEELNGKNQSMKIHFDTVKCRSIRIINQGTNWDKNEKDICIKQIELFSNESKYSRGVFSTLVSQSEDHDPHKCPVFLSASNFDFNTFHSINSNNTVCTKSHKNSWFQIEFTQGSAILHGFRMKRCHPNKMRSYKIICTDDVYKAEEEWTTLIEINEETENEHELLDIYEFTQPIPPTKYVRLIQTGPNWNNTLNLKFFHFDLFGNYLIT